MRLIKGIGDLSLPSCEETFHDRAEQDPGDRGDRERRSAGRVPVGGHRRGHPCFDPDPDSAGLPGSVEVVRGDLSAPTTLDACLDGVDGVAAVAVRVLTAEVHGGAKYALTGPQSLTQVEQARTIGAAIGLSVRFEEISPEDARREMLTAWGDPSVVDGILNAVARMVMEPELITSTVEEITGTPARTFHEWVIDHADDFRRSPGG